MWIGTSELEESGEIMDGFVWFGLGFILASVLWIIADYLYKGTLVIKSKDGTAECIDGEFYYIVHSDKYSEFTRRYWREELDKAIGYEQPDTKVEPEKK